MAGTAASKNPPPTRPGRKPRGYWHRPETIRTLQRYLDNEVTLEQAMSELNCDEEDVRWYVRELSKGRLQPKEPSRTDVVSFRISGSVSDNLLRLSRIAGRSIGETAAMLLNEKLREEEYPFIEFRASPLGRQPFVKGSSLAVWEVVLIARQMGMDPERTASYLQWAEPKVRSALSYAQAYDDEIEPFVNKAEKMGVDDLKRKLPWLREVRV